MVSNGDALLAPAITRRLIEEFTSAPQPAADGTHLLSARESEVLNLLARGMSNREIAAQLFLGDTTVKSHVTHFLTKLGLRDRIHAVVFAYENGIDPRGS